MENTLTWQNDPEYHEAVLKAVRKLDDGWDLTREDGAMLRIPGVPGVKPQIGSVVRFYGRGNAYPCRGVVVDGQLVYYRTLTEQEAKLRQEQDVRDRERRERFEQHRTATDARYAALPEAFRRRIDRFRAANPDFRWQYESYELCVCEQAALFADTLKTVKAIDHWRKLPWAKMEAAVPGLKDYSHNVWECACYLAKLFVVDPEQVVGIPGAMSPLVGTADYSDKK